MSPEEERSSLWWAWFGLIGLALALLAARDSLAWTITYPDDWVVPLTPWLNDMMGVVIDVLGPFFRAFSAALEHPMSWVRDVLAWLPWSAIVGLLTLASFATSGWRLALFTFCAMFYMVAIGYWAESMNSLSLVLVSVPAAVLLGFAAGTAGFFSQRVERILSPTMDVLQTIPAFAYLLPILLLFGFGPVVGLIASVVYAFPPMVRNTTLGLRRVDPEVIEAGLMAGATPGQMFWRVRVPSAIKQILLGVNQTTMAAFSMVIVASIIGGTSDIGWEVLSTMRKAQFGESLLAGIVIALMAMVMDRLTAQIAQLGNVEDEAERSFLERHRYWIGAGAMLVGILLVSPFVTVLKDYPESWEVYPARYINDAVTFVVVEFAGAIQMIKNVAFFYVMLPIKIGFEQTISPYSWGFSFTPGLRIAYAAAALALTGIAAWRLGPRQAVLFACLAMLFFYGLTRLPWPVLIAMPTLLAWQLGGRVLATGTFLGLSFLLVAGIWPQAVLSVYLCGIAVALSFAIGTLLGILAAESPVVSAFLRPINDTLQTMPLFVILIPFVMIFKIGEFTALLSIMAYAIVPAVRYAEHGLKSISDEVVEAAKACGATRWQLLWRVRLPLAMPVLMLGLNQTIMFAIAMLVIAALVGTNELGQRVYIGLGDGDFGVGMVAGIGMAIIAMIADRITQAWSRKRQEALGF